MFLRRDVLILLLKTIHIRIHQSVFESPIINVYKEHVYAIF